MGRVRTGSAGRIGAAALAVALLAALTVAAPAGAQTREAVLVIDKTSIVWGPTLPHGAGSSETVQVRNIGNADATGLTVTFSQPSFRGFGECVSTIQPGGQCTMSLSFSPQDFGVQTGTATFTTSAGTLTVALRGTGAGSPFPLRVTPRALDFGDLAVGHTSPTQVVTFTNVTDADFSFTGTQGTTPAPFAKLGGCTGAVTLAPGESCSAAYRFAPTGAGPASATPRFEVKGAANRVYTFTLAGRGTTDTRFPLLVTPTRLHFGDIDAGTTSAPQSSVVTNTTGSPVSFTATGPAPTAPFAGGTDCTGSPKVLAPGASCTFDRTFAPTVGYADEETTPITFTIGGSGPGAGTSRTIALTAEGYGRTEAAFLQVSATAVDFGFIRPGSPGPTRSVQLRNLGQATSGPITATDPGGPFTITSYCGATLAPKQECQLTYGYTGVPTGADPVATSTITQGTQSEVVTLRAHAAPPVPVPHDDAYTVIPGHTLTVTDPAKGVLANDEGRALRISASTGGPAHGDLDLWPDGTFTYVPDDGFEGVDMFPYHASDLTAQGWNGLVTVTVRSPHPAFVRATYTDLWGVTVDELLVADDAARLDSGELTREGHLRYLAYAHSAIAGDIERAYLLALRRHASSRDRSNLTQAIYFGQLRYGSLVGNLFASSEYERKFGDGTLSGWLDQVYLDLLGRPADPGGHAYWLAVAQRSGRGVVARSLYGSNEAERHRVVVLYDELLGRTADPGGITYWAARIVSGDRPVVLGLARTERYLQHAQERFPD
jgi:hypothetical protein